MLPPATIEGCTWEASKLCRRSQQMKNGTTDNEVEANPGRVSNGRSRSLQEEARGCGSAQEAVVRTKFKFANSGEGSEDALERVRVAMAKAGFEGRTKMEMLN
jgi:hypothetical protein